MKVDINRMKFVSPKERVRASDICNTSIRHILYEAGVQLTNKEVKKEDIFEAEKFFNFTCPYSGEDISESLMNKNKGLELEHIIGDNRKSCGLSIMGNLIFLKSDINNKKNRQNYEGFILNNPIVPGTTEEKLERIRKIKSFQKKYDYEKYLDLNKTIANRLNDIYSEIKEKLKSYVDEIVCLIENCNKENI